MSDIQNIMKFECLPNEILVECFDFLNAPDIFYSFDQLNYRFDRLIRNIPLCLSFQNIRKSVFDQFCMTMLLNPRIKKQIYSLKLSNKDTCGQIELFLSYFSLDTFTHLRLLSLTGVTQNNMNQLKLMVSLIPELCCIHLTDFHDRRKIETSAIEILSVPKLTAIHSIINLTLSYHSLHELNQIFKYVPMLKYLHVQYYPRNLISVDESSSFNRYYAVHLKQLIINQFPYKFEDIELFIKQASNLKSLTIIDACNIEMFDAYRWENLITSSLPHLNIFNFSLYSYDEDGTIVDKCKQFQTDFWYKQHHWYTEYVLRKDSGNIYTIPFITDGCHLNPYIAKYCNQPTKNYEVFNNVTRLAVHYDILTEKCQYYFPNVSSLTLMDKSGFLKMDDIILFETKYIEVLKRFVNLSKLNSLAIPETDQIKLSLFLLKILKETSQLSSLCIYSKYLCSTFSNNELCKYLNTMIKTLILYGDNYCSFNNSHEVKRFCEIFSNIERLLCGIKQREHLLYLLNHLPNLSIITVLFSCNDSYENLFSWFNHEASKLNVIFDMNDRPNKYTKLSIWIGKRMD